MNFHKMISVCVIAMTAMGGRAAAQVKHSVSRKDRAEANASLARGAQECVKADRDPREFGNLKRKQQLVTLYEDSGAVMTAQCALRHARLEDMKDRLATARASLPIRIEGRKFQREADEAWLAERNEAEGYLVKRTSYVLDSATAQVRWSTTILTDERFAEQRAIIDRVLADKKPYALDLSPMERMTVIKATGQIHETLKGMIGELPPMIYADANRFLKDLRIQATLVGSPVRPFAQNANPSDKSTAPKVIQVTSYAPNQVANP